MTILKIKFHEAKPKLPWITNIEDLNRIYREAKAVLIQPDHFHLAVLQAAIDIAEQPARTTGYHPGSLADPRD